MTDINIKDAAKKIFNNKIKNNISVKLDPTEEYHLQLVIEDAIRIGIDSK